ncbi:tumor necrosis factor ligand superfamily member 11 isoform X2 [Alosa pseudoharengus]|uniref:tumor necrosis factor ligand superfamily member 11 isoform X2 n=1 Tax=Alosa sapidissima TaxID=34773 RepID=UPI001C08D741|nr:tumor necrosis factor ligand superfamily member 11 isoform X2 [Alosa sapidissima]XP_048094684.1 tumor necrosis factor ligand superfamily member 11 isoform X2 [Alosa alosa]
MAANEYRSYLRNHFEMETGQPRFHAAQSTAPTYRSLIFGTLAVIGLLQVASSVAILLHLTGYLREIDISSTQEKPLEEIRTEPYLADALKDQRKSSPKTKCPKKREVIPEAHLPIRGPIDFSNKDQKTVMIHWSNEYGRLKKIKYNDGRILVEKGGLYYVYAKTCFRHYFQSPGQPDVSNAQLIQYVYHEKHTQSTIKPILLMKSGSTMRWDDKHYNMYCVQQGRGIHLSQGDGIFVNVSNSWLLDPEPEGSYFGALKLGTSNELC